MSIREFLDYIKNSFNGNLLTRYWQIGPNHIVEIYSPQVDKKNGIEDAIKYYNIKPENTIAIGDGHNDIGMLSVCHHKVAMGNAHPDLLQVANHVTDRIENQGVLKFLKNYFEKK